MSRFFAYTALVIRLRLAQGSSTYSFDTRTDADAHMVTGCYVTYRCWHVALLSSGIADLLSGGSRSIDDLAATTHTAHAPSLGRLSRSAPGRFAGHHPGYWQPRLHQQTVCGAAIPPPHNAWVQLYGGIQQHLTWQDFYGLRTGQPAFTFFFGASTTTTWPAIPTPDAALVDLAWIHSVDTWLATIRHQHHLGRRPSWTSVVGRHCWPNCSCPSHLRAPLFDLPHVVAGGAPLLERAGVLNRCRILGGIMFTTISHWQ